MQFVDRFLKCSDCSVDFVFTAGEQLFFNDKQFKNDPKRCKLCKAKRAGLGHSSNPNAVAALPFSRTETRTECSACGIETTVPFKPTQGRPVLCRSCFQSKRVPSGAAAVATMASAAAQVAAASAALTGAIAADGLPLAGPFATTEVTAEKPATTTSALPADADAEVAAASAAFSGAIAADGLPLAGPFATTMEMIAETPAAITSAMPADVEVAAAIAAPEFASVTAEASQAN